MSAARGPAPFRAEAGLLRDGLLAGAWPTGRETFLHYGEEARVFLREARDHGPAAARAVASAESRPESWEDALLLASAVDALWALASPPGVPGLRTPRSGAASRGRAVREVRGTPVLLSWCPTADGLAGFVAGPGSLAKALVAPLAPLLERRGVALRLSDGEGRVWLRGGPREPGSARRADDRAASDEALAPVVRSIAAWGRQTWRLETASADPEADRLGLAGRERRLLAASALVLVLMVTIYFSSRA